MMWCKATMESGWLLPVVSMLLSGVWMAAAANGQIYVGGPPPYTILQQRPDRLLAVLPNRLVVIVQELRTAPVVSAQVWVKTGSIYEQSHVGAGLSHYLEHLVAGGTTSQRSEQQSNELLGLIGARTNAATGLDNVRYYIDTTSDHTEQAIELLSDWLQNCQIPEPEFERERQVIEREFEMGQGEPGRIFWKLTQQARYRAHPARHPTIGYEEEFARISRGELLAFYQTMYVPNNMVFVVVGDVDKRHVMEQVARLWKDKSPGRLPTITLPIEPPINQPRELSGRADVSQARLRLAWPGTRLAGEGDYALDLLAVILGQGESSRLVRAVRDEQRLVNTIQAYNLSFPWGEGFFGIDAEVARSAPAGAIVGGPQSTEETLALVKAAVLKQVARIQTEGITPVELARAKRQIMAQVVSSGQSAQAVAQRLAGDLIGMGDPDYLRRYAQRIQELSAAQVVAVADQFLTGHRLISVHLLPQEPGAPVSSLQRPNDHGDDKEALPNETVVLDNAALVDRLQHQQRDLPDAAASIVTEPVRRYLMPNGLRLLVGRSTLVPAVSMQMYQLGGGLADEPGREGLAFAVAAMRIKGTTTRSAQRIADEVENLGAALSTTCGHNTQYSMAECLREDWPVVLELLADVVLNPVFSEEEWRKLQPRLLAAIPRQADTWNGQLQRHFRESYFTTHPWAHSPMGRQEVVNALTVEDLRAFHARRLGASESVLAVFGDVEPDQVAQRVRELFAAMPKAPLSPFKAPHPQAPQEQRLEFKTNKPLAAVQIGYGPAVTRRNKDFAAMQVLTRVLSDFPSGWLEQELRGKGSGLAYAVSAGLMTGVVPGYFAVLFNTQPAQVEQAMERAAAVIQRIQTEQVDGSTLARAKASVLTGEFLSKQSNNERAMDAALNELYELGLDEPVKFRREVEQLTPPMLQVIAQTYLRNPVAVVLRHETPGGNAPTP